MDETKIGDVGLHLKEYVKIQYELNELRLIEKTAVSGAKLISGFVVASVLVISVLFLSLSLVFYLSQLIGSLILSFFLIGAFYIMIALLFTLFKKRWLLKPLRNQIVKGLTREDNL